MTDQDNAQDGFIPIIIEDMVDLIREGKSVEVIYQDCPYPHPNIITLICEDKYCNDIREIQPIISSHSPTQIRIRSQNKDNAITEWKEYFVHSASVYFTFKVNHTAGQVSVEQKVDASKSLQGVNSG